MRRTTLLPPLALLLACCADSRPRVDVSGLEVSPRVATASVEFGVDLFRRLDAAAPEQNLFVSPLSVAFALAVAAEGAAGDTRAEIERTLRLAGLDRDALGGALRDARLVLENVDPKVELGIASSVWVKPGVTPKEEFVKRCADFHDAAVSTIEDPAAIDAWVSKATYGRIEHLAAPLAPDALVLLLNAVYFQGTWKETFAPSATEDGPFTRADGTKVTVPMMRQEESFPYLETKAFEAIALPYGDGRFQMRIFLPKKGTTLDELLDDLTPETWAAWSGWFAYGSGRIVLPRFTLRCTVSLDAALAAMGMADTFTSEADFRALADGEIFLTGARQQTLLEVNEEGTVAVAVTELTVGAAVSPKPFEVVVDHPFLAAIVDAKTGTLLFLGAIRDPSAG